MYVYTSRYCFAVFLDGRTCKISIMQEDVEVTYPLGPLSKLGTAIQLASDTDKGRPQVVDDRFSGAETARAVRSSNR